MALQQVDILTEGSVVQESREWPAEIYLIDEQDYVHGGVHGYDNVPHEQLANRTVYLKGEIADLSARVDALTDDVNAKHEWTREETAAIRLVVAALDERLVQLKAESEVADQQLRDDIAAVDDRLNVLRDEFDHHKHNYAGSDVPSGDALTVRTRPSVTEEVSLIGVTNGAFNALLRSKVKVRGDELTATTVHGDLDGNARTATRLSRLTTLSLTGDVGGFAQFDGTTDPTIHTTIAVQPGVADGSYGPSSDIVLDNLSTITVPSFTVNRSGIITKVNDRIISLPNLMRSMTAGATPTDGKLFIVGAENQSDVENTYTEDGAYIIDGELFSNRRPVVTTTGRQAINNKTYEGYTLGPACARAVDNTIGGTRNSTALVTSNALFRHTHHLNYALSDSEGGPAKEVVINGDTTVGDLVVNTTGNALFRNRTVKVGNGVLEANELTATAVMNIPGGSIWIDTEVIGSTATDGTGEGSVKYDDSELRMLIDGVNDGVNAVVGDVTTLANRVADVADTMTIIGDRMQTLTDNMTTTKNEQRRVSASVADALVTVADVSARMDSFDADVADAKLVSNRTTHLEDRVTALEAEVNALRDDLTTLETRVDTFIDGVATREVTLKTGVMCSAGMLLSYSPAGYVLADNRAFATADQVVLSTSGMTADGKVRVVDQGAYELPDASFDGVSVAVGENGALASYATVRATAGRFIHYVGYVEGRMLRLRLFSPTMNPELV